MIKGLKSEKSKLFCAPTGTWTLDLLHQTRTFNTELSACPRFAKPTHRQQLRRKSGMANSNVFRLLTTCGRWSSDLSCCCCCCGFWFLSLILIPDPRSTGFVMFAGRELSPLTVTWGRPLERQVSFDLVEGTPRPRSWLVLFWFNSVHVKESLCTTQTWVKPIGLT